MTQTKTSPMEELLRHSAWLRRFAVALVRDEDVAQETLVVAWNNRATIRQNLRSWMAEVARNRARDHARAESRRRSREMTAQEVLPAFANGADELLGEADLHRTIADSVTRLDEPFRQVVVWRYYEGLSSAEIARRLRMPAGTVRWRLSEGLSRVRADLDRRHGGDRRRWMLALAPIAGRGGDGPGLRSAGALTVAAGFLKIGVAVVAAIGVMAAAWYVAAPRRPDQRSAAVTGLTPTPAEPSEGYPPGGASSGAAAELAAPSCEAQVDRLHGELVQVERDLFEWDRAYAFDLGKPNPAAERVLEPLLVPALSADPDVLEHRLVCRTWICHLVLRKATGSGYGSELLRSNAALWSRLRGLTGTIEAPAHGMKRTQSTFLVIQVLFLKDPTAAATSDAAVPPPRPRPVLTTAGSCETARSLAQELATLRPRWSKAEPHEHRFARERENPGLAREIESSLPWWKQLLSSTSCRGTVCEQEPIIPFVLPSGLWDARLSDNPAFTSTLR